MTNAEKYKSAEEQTEAFKDFCKTQTRCLQCPAYCEKTCAMCQFVWLGLEAPKDLRAAIDRAIEILRNIKE